MRCSCCHLKNVASRWESENTINLYLHSAQLSLRNVFARNNDQHCYSMDLLGQGNRWLPLLSKQIVLIHVYLLILKD